MKMSHATPIALFTTFTLFTGCNELLNDDETDTDTTVATTSLSGVVADGYIQNAIACLDINSNGACDSDEPTATTSSTGAYSFDVNLGDEDSYPVVVEVPVGAIDSDYGEVTKPYSLSAPAGYGAFVSPMTTILQNNIAINPGLTAQDAEEELLEIMGITDTDISLFEDYIENESEAYDVIHTVAQIVASEIANNMEIIEQSATDGDIEASVVSDNKLEISVLITNNIISELDTIVVDVNTAYDQLEPNETLDYEEALSIAEDIDVTVDVEDLSDDLDSFDNLLNAKVSIDVFGDFAAYFEQYNNDIALDQSIYVTAKANDWGGHHNQLEANLTTTPSKSSDVVLVDAGMMSKYLQSDALSDLTEQFSSYKSELAPYAVAKGIDAEGKQKFIPIDAAPIVSFYRRDYMEDLEFDIDEVMTSWETFYDYGIYLRDNETVTYYVDELDENGYVVVDENGDNVQVEETSHVYLVSNAGTLFRALVYGTVENDEGVFTDANGDYALDSQRITDAFTYIQRLKDADLIANTGMWNDDWYNGFREGRFAVEIQANWLAVHLKGWIAPDTADKWGVAALPEGTNSWAGGSFAAIPESTENKAEAWKLIEYMLEAENQLSAFENWSMLPANTTIYSNTALDQADDFFNDQKTTALYTEVALAINSLVEDEFDYMAEQLIMNDALNIVLNSDESLDNILAYAIKTLNCEMGELNECATQTEGDFVSSGIAMPNFAGNIQYKLELTAQTDLIINVEDLTGAQYMLLDSELELIEPEFSAMNEVTLETGTYYIEVTANKLGSDGEYTLSVDSIDVADLEAVTLTLHNELPPVTLVEFDTVTGQWDNQADAEHHATTYIQVDEAMQIEFTLNTQTWMWFDVWSEGTDYVFDEYNSNGTNNVTVRVYVEPGTYNLRAITNVESQEDYEIIISTSDNDNFSIVE